MAELAPSGGGPNRLFVVLAVGLGALLILGVIAVGGIMIIQRIGAPATAPTPFVLASTPTRVVIAAASATPVTPTEQATPTFVLIAGGTTETPGAASTTGATPTTAPGQLPRSGRSEDLLLLGGGLLLVLIVFAARRARVSGRT